MPAITSSIQVAEGVSVFTYEGREGFFLRRWNKHSRSYKVRKIKGVVTQAEALIASQQALVQLDASKVIKSSRTHTGLLTKEIEEFLRWESKRVDAGFKNERAHMRRKTSLMWFASYLEQQNIEYASEIREGTLDDYLYFRKNVRRNTCKIELKDIGVFIRHWLMKNRLISNELGQSPFLIPRITITDDELDANPAITPNDYQTINLYLRGEFQERFGTFKGKYTRRMFYTYVHILKNSGCRPSELLAVRLKDIEITNPKRWSVSNEEWEDDYKLKIHIRKSKTGKRRDVICRSNSGKHLLEFLDYQKKHMKMHYPKCQMSLDSLLFGRPELHLEKTYHYRYLDNNWNQVREALEGQLEGNRFSSRPYTLYSTRATFIEECIADNLDVYLVARLCGNSVGIIQKYYDRHDVIKRASEIQELPIGVTKPREPEVVNVLEV